MGTPPADRAGGPGSLLDWGRSSGGYFANCWTWFASACVLHDCYLLCACTLSLKPLVPRSALLWGSLGGLGPTLLGPMLDILFPMPTSTVFRLHSQRNLQAALVCW